MKIILSEYYKIAKKRKGKKNKEIFPLYKKHQPNLRTIQELEKKGIKPIWACDKANVESDRLAQRLGYVNPLEYEFVYLEPPKEN